MELLFWTLIFIVALAALIKSSDIFTDTAEHIGLSAGLSRFVVGVTIVAFGTSLPELVSSIFAVVRGASEIVAGNVFGSNIANIFLVLGVSAILAKKIIIRKNNFDTDLTYLVIGTIVVTVFSFDGTFTIVEGIICAILLIASTIKTVSDKTEKILEKPKLQLSNVALFVISGFGVFFGAKYTIDAVLFFSGYFGIGSEIIAASVVALGTSLPEVSVSAAAALKGKPEIAIGNVLGSNVFNTLGVMGIASLWGPLTISPSITLVTLPLMLLATIVFLYVCFDRKVDKREGIILTCAYVAFIAYLFLG